MNLALIPMLIIALLMATIDSSIETVEFVLAGEHRVTEHRGALIVGDATVVIPTDAIVSGPVYVIGGELVVDGSVATDVVQLAGIVTIPDGGRVAGTIQEIGGNLDVASTAEVGRRTRVVPRSDQSPASDIAVTAVSALVLSAVGALLTRRRRALLDTVTQALTDHPLVVVTVGALVFLTAIALLVFMAFTLVLLPLSILGLVAGLVTFAYGVIALGHLIGSRLPIERRELATATGVGATVVALRLADLVPFVGSLAAIGVMLGSLGAVLVTYFGLARFRVPTLPAA